LDSQITLVFPNKEKKIDSLPRDDVISTFARMANEGDETLSPNPNITAILNKMPSPFPSALVIFLSVLSPRQT
jgi:hypothetical protein